MGGEGGVNGVCDVEGKGCVNGKGGVGGEDGDVGDGGMDGVGGVNSAGEVDDFGVSGVGGVIDPITKPISASFFSRAGSVNKRNKTFVRKIPKIIEISFEGIQYIEMVFLISQMIEYLKSQRNKSIFSLFCLRALDC